MDCSHQPGCLDPVFGPNQASFYWSSTIVASFTINAFGVNFNGGNLENSSMARHFYARGVRGGR